MRAFVSSGLRRVAWRHPVVAVLASTAAVAAVTGAVFALRGVAPVLSLGVLYLFAVLPVAALWGLGFALSVSVVSMLAFNWLFLPPTHTFRLENSENWVALAVYLVTSVSVSELAARSRRRADEAERLAREVQETEALRRSDAAKTALLRSVSHDLRSPVTAILTNTELLAEAGSDATAREELLAAIRLEAHRLERLIGNLLDLSRLEVGGARPEPELWTVDGLLGRALGALRTGSARIDIDLVGDPAPVRVDPAQVEHALVNVLENALKFSNASTRVLVRAEQQGDHVVIIVSDEGPGVALQEEEAIFEPFARGSLGDGARGSGLGLAIARGFVAVNGGRIWLERKPGAGAAFAIALPAVPDPVVT